MLKRLISGIVIGLVVGAIAAAGVIKGLHVLSFAEANLGTMIAYVAALATGAFVALVAGKPVWAKGAWIEVGLKAFFGSLLAAGGMFALRRWGLMSINLAGFGAGAGALGYLPASALPIIATLLSIFFEIDNTDAPEEPAPAKLAGKPQVRVAASTSGASSKGARVVKDEGDGEDEPVASKKQRS
jgi:energy-converting hydrogenase Eha subunit A